MKSDFSHPLSAASVPFVSVATAAATSICPFRDGAATLDGLLAELDPTDIELFDAALDLRSLAAAGADGDACVEQLFRVRALLDGRHYLAFYRVRHWARCALRIEVRAGRGMPWQSRLLPLDGARVEEIINGALSSIAADYRGIPDSTQVRFSFAPTG